MIYFIVQKDYFLKRKGLPLLMKKAVSKSLFLNKKKNGFLQKREFFNFLRNEKPEFFALVFHLNLR